MTLTDTLQPVLEKTFPAALVASFLLQSAEPPMISLSPFEGERAGVRGR